MIELILQNSQTGTIYDLSDLIVNCSWNTTLDGSQPGKFEFNYVNDNKVIINEGSVIRVKYNNQPVFFGYVFKRSKTSKEIVSVTCYDQTRYLKNKNTYIFKSLTASKIFEKLAGDFGLKYKVIDPSNYVLQPKIYDNKALYEVIQSSLDETLIKTDEWYIIRDNFGVLNFVNLNSLKTNLIIGDNSLASDFKFESSIDDDSFNQIKLIKENKDGNKRNLFIVKDSSNISKWGTLQYYEKVDDQLSEVQIKERADKLLKLKNRVTKTLSIPCMGDLRVFAGVGVIIELEQLEIENINLKSYFLVRSCTHQFSDGLHKMDIELQVN